MGVEEPRYIRELGTRNSWMEDLAECPPQWHLNLSQEDYEVKYAHFNSNGSPIARNQQILRDNRSKLSSRYDINQHITHTKSRKWNINMQLSKRIVSRPNCQPTSKSPNQRIQRQSCLSIKKIGRTRQSNNPDWIWQKGVPGSRYHESTPPAARSPDTLQREGGSRRGRLIQQLTGDQKR